MTPEEGSEPKINYIIFTLFSDLSVSNGIAWVNCTTVIGVNGKRELLVIDMLLCELTASYKGVAAFKYARYMDSLTDYNPYYQ